MRMSVLSLALVGALGIAVAAGQKPADQKDWIQLFNGKNLDGWVPKIRGYDLGVNYADTFRVADGMLKASYDKYTALRGQVRASVLHAAEILALHHRGGVPLRRRAGAGRADLGRPQQRPDAPQPGRGDDGEGSGFSDLGRGAAARRPAERQAAIDGKRVHARHADLHERHDGERPLHELEVGDVSPAKAGYASRSRSAAASASRTGGRTDRARVRQPTIGGGEVTAFDPKVKVDGTLLTEGYIAIQGESHPTDFRKIELLNLSGCMDPKSPKYKLVLRARDAGRARIAARCSQCSCS